MRTKRAAINSSVNILSFLISFLPNFIIRKLFLNSLGSDLLGLNSLYTNIIGWLSIVEMGIGTAIIFSLYKPYANNDKQKINSYIGFYGRFYKKIGIIIFSIGVLIIPFLKYLIKDEIDIKIASLGFVLSLINSCITYFFSHRICILNVAQESYKVTIGSTITKLIISIGQIIMFKIYPNFILFISIQIVVNIVYYLLINKYILAKYPWLVNANEEIEENEKKHLLKNIKAMFAHKIGTLIVNSTDNIVISSFVGLKLLAIYTNYQMVISALQSIVNMGLTGLTASIGNLLVNEESGKAYKVHKKIFFINFWIVSFLTISLSNTLNQFIVLWIGKKYLLDSLTFSILLINMYFATMRGSVEQFQSASGNYHQDRYAAFIEAIINLITSLVLVKYIGIAGVFMGTLISNFTVVFWTKPYVVYRYVFNKNLVEYFKMYFKYLLIGLIPLIITNCLTKKLKLDYSLTSFIINCSINIIIINLVYIFIFWRTDEFKYYLNLIKNLIKND